MDELGRRHQPMTHSVLSFVSRSCSIDTIRYHTVFYYFIICSTTVFELQVVVYAQKDKKKKVGMR